MKKNLPIVVLAFCLVTTLFMAIPVLAGTSPPFDLYAAVKNIQTKVNLIWPGIQEIGPQLSSMQELLAALEQKLWSASDSIKNDTLTINQKLVNISKIESANGTIVINATNYAGNKLDVEKSKPFKLTMTVFTYGFEEDEEFAIGYDIGNAHVGMFVLNVNTNRDPITFECTTTAFQAFAIQLKDGFTIFYNYVIEYSD